MYARILRMQTNIEGIDEASTLFEREVVPLCKERNGHKGAFFLADRKTGNCIIVTVWETEEDLLETEHSRFFQEQLVKFMKYFVTPPIREVYEFLYIEYLKEAPPKEEEKEEEEESEAEEKEEEEKKQQSR